jgi:hypothetical protein
MPICLVSQAMGPDLRPILYIYIYIIQYMYNILYILNSLDLIRFVSLQNMYTRQVLAQYFCLFQINVF